MSASSQSPHPPRRLSAENRRDQILCSALSLFIERGFEAVSMADIAASLGTSRPTVYTYFASTEAILEALLQERLERLPERLAPYLSPDGPTSFRALFLALLQERELLLLLSSGGGPTFRTRRQAFITAITERLQLQELGEQKSLLVGRKLHPLLQPIIVNLLSGMASEHMYQSHHDPQALAATLDEFISGGMEQVLLATESR